MTRTAPWAKTDQLVCKYCDPGLSQTVALTPIYIYSIEMLFGSHCPPPGQQRHALHCLWRLPTAVRPSVNHAGLDLSAVNRLARPLWGKGTCGIYVATTNGSMSTYCTARGLHFRYIKNPLGLKDRQALRPFVAEEPKETAGP